MATVKSQLRHRESRRRPSGLARSKQHRAYTLAITSGKGGVGKTNIAVNLSIALASEGLRVVLVDMDMGLANADVLLNLQAPYNISHVLSGLRTIGDVMVDGPGGIRFVPGASGLERLANLSEFERQSVSAQLRTLDRGADMVILDCGAGISQTVLGFARQADRILVVTTPEPTAITDAYATIKTLCRLDVAGELLILVNGVDSRAEAKQTYERLACVARRFLNLAVADGGYVLHDMHVALAVRQRSPFVLRYPRSTASACLKAIAGELVSSRFPSLQSDGFFKRVVALFV